MATPSPAALKAGFKTEMNLGAPADGIARKKHFHVSDDTKAQTETAGYFNPVAEYITNGDLVEVAGDLDGTKWTRSYIITKPSSGDLTVTAAAVS